MQNPRTQPTGRRTSDGSKPRDGGKLPTNNWAAELQYAYISLVNRRELPPPSFPSPGVRKEAPKNISEHLTRGHFISVELRRRIRPVGTTADKSPIEPGET